VLGRGCATSIGSVCQFLVAPVFGAGAGAVFRVAEKSSDSARRRARPAVADGVCVCCLQPRSETFTTGQGIP